MELSETTTFCWNRAFILPWAQKFPLPAVNITTGV
jgi:hypothetical protein